MKSEQKILAVFILTIVMVVFSRANLVAQSAPKNIKEMQKYQKKITEQLDQNPKEMEKHQSKMLESLKTMNPEMYQEQKALLDRKKKIDAILRNFRNKKINLQTAKSQLKPLVSKEVREEVKHIDQQINRAKKKLEKLRKIKKNPESLIVERIDLLLGVKKPDFNMQEIYFP